MEIVDKEVAGRREEAEFLRSEAAKILARMKKVASELSTRDEDVEKQDQMEKSVRLAKLIKQKLGPAADAPPDETLAEVRGLVREAKMHANEAEPA